MVLRPVISTSQQMERERENIIAARREQLIERRAEFQRQTLLDLQDALFDLMRTTGARGVALPRGVTRDSHVRRCFPFKYHPKKDTGCATVHTLIFCGF